MRYYTRRKRCTTDEYIRNTFVKDNSYYDIFFAVGLNDSKEYGNHFIPTHSETPYELRRFFGHVSIKRIWEF